VASGAVAPTLDEILPTSGQVRGGDTVELSGSNIDAEAVTVTFGGAAATIVDATSTTITVLTPEGTTEGEVVDVAVVQTGGTDVLTSAYTYTENAIDLAISGTTHVGDILTITIYGPANSRAGVAVGAPGALEKAGLTFCFDRPIAFKKNLTELNLGPTGQVSTTWTIAGAAFDNKNVQGAVKVGSGPGSVLVQTDCEVLTVFP
jgi:hypothetical protein